MGLRFVSCSFEWYCWKLIVVSIMFVSVLADDELCRAAHCRGYTDLVDY